MTRLRLYLPKLEASAYMRPTEAAQPLFRIATTPRMPPAPRRTENIFTLPPPVSDYWSVPGFPIEDVQSPPRIWLQK